MTESTLTKCIVFLLDANPRYETAFDAITQFSDWQRGMLAAAISNTKKKAAKKAFRVIIRYSIRDKSPGGFEDFLSIIRELIPKAISIPQKEFKSKKNSGTVALTAELWDHEDNLGEFTDVTYRPEEGANQIQITGPAYLNETIRDALSETVRSTSSILHSNETEEFSPLTAKKRLHELNEHWQSYQTVALHRLNRVLQSLAGNRFEDYDIANELVTLIREEAAKAQLIFRYEDHCGVTPVMHYSLPEAPTFRLRIGTTSKRIVYSRRAFPVLLAEKLQ